MSFSSKKKPTQQQKKMGEHYQLLVRNFIKFHFKDAFTGGKVIMMKYIRYINVPN